MAPGRVIACKTQDKQDTRLVSEIVSSPDGVGSRTDPHSAESDTYGWPVGVAIVCADKIGLVSCGQKVDSRQPRSTAGRVGDGAVGVL